MSPHRKCKLFTDKIYKKERKIMHIDSREYCASYHSQYDILLLPSREKERKKEKKIREVI
jgi:hypothetical protein